MTSDASIFLLRDRLATGESLDVIEANLIFLHELFAAGFEPHEVPEAALTSLYVDQYVAEMNNGGFAQFVYNTNWDPLLVDLVAKGLSRIDAPNHAALFARCRAIVDRAGGEPFDEDRFEASMTDAERGFLDGCFDEFFEISKQEDIVELNAAWLRDHADVVLCTQDELNDELARRAGTPAEIAERSVRALAKEPRHMKLIRALCDASGQTFDRVTAGDINYVWKGERALAWCFLTNEGRHHMLDLDGRAMMFTRPSEHLVATIEADEGYGPIPPRPRPLPKARDYRPLQTFALFVVAATTMVFLDWFFSR